MKKEVKKLRLRKILKEGLSLMTPIKIVSSNNQDQDQDQDQDPD